MIYPIIFLISIVIANLTVSYFGPWMIPVNSLVLIGLDLSLRDKLHDKWHNNGLKWKMLCLVVASGLLTYILNKDAGRIAFASVIAFTMAMIVDIVIYQLLFNRKRFLKINGSNVGSAIADSILFPTIAFGAFMPWVIISQAFLKIFGGAIWSIVILKWTPCDPLDRNGYGK